MTAVLVLLALAGFSGEIVSASADAPPCIDAGSLVAVAADVWLDGQPYPVWFTGDDIWWFGAPGRPDVHRGWVRQTGATFDGVYGTWTSTQAGPYWKFWGNVTHMPEPTTAALFAVAAMLVQRRGAHGHT